MGTRGVALGALFLCACSSDCSKSGAAADAATALADAATAVAETPDAPMNATPIPKDKVEAVLNPEHLPVYDGPTASVEGTITIVGDPAPVTPGLDFSKCPGARDTYERAFREGPARPDGSRPLADAIVAVTGYAGYILPEKNARKEITVKDCAYSTRAIDLTFGQVLDVRNLDADPKRMYAPEIRGAELPALMLAPPGGDPVSVYPRQPGSWVLFDRMGPPFMTVDLFALKQPLHAVTDVAGHFRIDGIPARAADGGVVDTLYLNAAHAAVGRQVTKKMAPPTPGVVETIDLQLDYHPDAGAPSAPTSEPAKADAGKKVIIR